VPAPRGEGRRGSRWRPRRGRGARVGQGGEGQNRAARALAPHAPSSSSLGSRALSRSRSHLHRREGLAHGGASCPARAGIDGRRACVVVVMGGRAEERGVGWVFREARGEGWGGGLSPASRSRPGSARSLSLLYNRRGPRRPASAGDDPCSTDRRPRGAGRNGARGRARAREGGREKKGKRVRLMSAEPSSVAPGLHALAPSPIAGRRAPARAIKPDVVPPRRGRGAIRRRLTSRFLGKRRAERCFSSSGGFRECLLWSSCLPLSPRGGGGRSLGAVVTGGGGGIQQRGSEGFRCRVNANKQQNGERSKQAK
jgi:hypothetical protein